MNIPLLQSKFSDINNLLYQSYLPKIINAAIDIELFEILLEKPLSLDEITYRLKVNPEITDALLDVLSVIHLLEKQKDTYALSDLSREYLVQASDVQQINTVRIFDGSHGPFDQLIKRIRGEKNEFDSSMWSSREVVLHMEQGVKAGAIQTVLSFVQELPEFSSCLKMCDFAGNIGYYSYAFLQENQQLFSHVYDLPLVCQLARELKHTEATFSRIAYHESDFSKGDSFGNGYDLFFSSHFLYDMGFNGKLTAFLKRVNQSMTKGGVFISNHLCEVMRSEDRLLTSLIELQTRIVGYPTHQLPEPILKKALLEAGFDDFTVKYPDGSCAYATMLLAARKKRDL